MTSSYLYVITDFTCFQQQIQQYVGMVMLTLPLLTDQTNQSYLGSDRNLATVGCIIEKLKKKLLTQFISGFKSLAFPNNVSPHEQCQY